MWESEVQFPVGWGRMCLLILLAKKKEYSRNLKAFSENKVNHVLESAN